MKKIILSLSTTAMLCSSIFADEWTDYRVKNFRTDHAAIIEAKKKELGTTWDAIAIINITKDNINRSKYVEEVQEHLDLLKAVYKGVGFANGVVKAEISQQERNHMLGGLTAYARYIDKPWQGFVTQNYGANKPSSVHGHSKGAVGDASILPAHLEAVDDQIRKSISSSLPSEPLHHINESSYYNKNLSFSFSDFDDVLPSYYNETLNNNLLRDFGHREDFHTLLETIEDHAIRVGQLNKKDDDYSFYDEKRKYIEELCEHLHNAFLHFNMVSSKECFDEIKNYVMNGFFSESFYKRMKNTTLQSCIEKFREENKNKDRKDLDSTCFKIIEELKHVTDENYNEKYIDDALKFVKVPLASEGIEELSSMAIPFSFPKKEGALIIQLLETPSAFDEHYTREHLLYHLNAIQEMNVEQRKEIAATDSIQLAIQYKKAKIVGLWARYIYLLSGHYKKFTSEIIALTVKCQTNEEKFKLAEILSYCMEMDDRSFGLTSAFLEFSKSNKDYNEFISNKLNPYLQYNDEEEFKSLLP